MRLASSYNSKNSFLLAQKAVRAIWILTTTTAILLASFGLSAVKASGPSSNRMLNYQIRLTDLSGNLVSDGTYNVKLVIYDAAQGGNQLYSVCSADGTATGTPTAVQMTLFSGVGSVLIGDTTNTCTTGSAVAMPATLFNNTLMYLGVTVESDTEMTTRKRIVGTGYAMNADRLDDLESSFDGGTTAYVPVTDSFGNLTLTGTPQGTGVTQGTLTINPATADANEALFGVALGGSLRFMVDEDGDAVLYRSLVIGDTSTSAALDVLGNISTNSGTTNNVSRIRVTTPVDTTGTNIHQLLNLSATIGASAGGTNTVNLFAIDALTGAAEVKLNAFNLGTLTGTIAEEVAFRIGEGWDATFKSEQTATGGTDIAFSFDTENDLADADTLVSFMEQGTQKARIKADGAFVVGSASTTYGDGSIESSGTLSINSSSGQNVGIGMAPANKLHVSGNIGATGWVGAGCEGACEVSGGYSILYATGYLSLNGSTIYGSASYNNVGIGAAPSTTSKLHVYYSDAGTTTLLSALRLERQTTSTADVGLGVSLDWYIEDTGGTSNQAARIDALWEDATNTSEDAHLSFNLTNGGSLLEVARMDDDGYFGVKTLGAATANDLCYDTTTITGMATLSTCSGSSQRFKENIQDLMVDIDKVLSLRPVSFDWKDLWVENIDGTLVNMKQSGPTVGLIAEEVAALIPEIVKYDPDGQISGLEYKLLSVYELAILQLHHAELARTLKLDSAGGLAYVISPVEEAINEDQPVYNSRELSFRGLVRDVGGTAYQPLNFSIRNTVESTDEYRLSIFNNDGEEIIYFGQGGDLAIKGRLYLTAGSDLSTGRYIYYDDSVGIGGDFIRTNAAGWSTASSDFAEMFASDDDLQPGELVMLDINSAEKVKRADNERETNGYLLVGIVSTRPGFLAGLNEAFSFPVALQGRVPTKVNLENGPISIGDPITISSESGVGMRASESGYVVGIALENYDGSENDEDNLITVFLKAGWYNGSIVEQPNVDVSGRLDISAYGGVLDMGGYPIIGIGAMEGIDGLWSIDGNGKLTAKEVDADDVKAGELTVKASDSKTTIGEGLVPIGSSTYVVENPAIRFNSRIFVTFFGNVEGNWWISERSEGRFVIVLSRIAMTDISFEYWILDVADERTPVQSDEGSEIEFLPPAPSPEPPVVVEPSDEEPIEESPPATPQTEVEDEADEADEETPSSDESLEEPVADETPEEEPQDSALEA